MYPEPNLSTNLLANESYRQLVGRATRALWDAVGEADGRVSVNWELTKDYADRDELRLVLRDDGGGVAVALFSPDGLAREASTRGQFYRVYGRLLQDRTRTLLRELNELIATDEVAA